VGYHEGFAESVYLVKRLAENLGTPLEAITVGSDPGPEQYEALFETVEPEMSVSTTSLATWEDFREWIQDARASDFVVLLKPREGSLGWGVALHQLPDEILNAPPEAVVILTPRQEDPGSVNRFIRLR